MDFTYPQLFDIVDETPFDTDLFHGLHSQQDVEHNTKKQHSSSPSYLHYLQSTTTTTNTIPTTNTSNNLFYDSMHPLNLDLVDYDYTFQQPQCALDQKQQYNWLYDPIDTYLPQQNSLFCDETMMSNIMTSNNNQFDCIMSENDMEENITVEGGMSRGYVSLSDVNSFVAKADSAKQQHACLLQLSSLQENLLLDDFSLKPPHQNRDFMSSSESTNDDSEDDYSDNNSDIDLRWNALMSSYGVPAMHATSSAVNANMPTAVTNNNNTTTTTTHANEKLMIKIKKPKYSVPSPMSSALPSPYGEHPWDLVSPKSSKSAGYKSSSKYRKSMSNIYNAATATSSGKKKTSKFDSKGRRGSAPHRLTIHNNTSASSMGSLHSSSSLSSLSNNLQRSMRVSESIHSLLSDEDEADQELEEEHELLLEEEEEDDDDDEYQIRAPNAPNHGQLPTKKGRNVDKACNHCKRSHLRCDDMRPCRRCVATGKQGCKDVQHKPRGRPKLHKKLTK
ncbi:Zn(2)-C6 fungal-specific transcription factor [Mucor lusitanicus]|uniref:Zn(2)-C6 fungal-specific transcription factor n=2 Tax=Mucor circinelloides f. lusitanicus TaxID=29924 RepID=A0A162QZ13_MUCCL|nr:Zn(2)-C6 fungal-specific transcription factor [Mucor lusitanicus]OAD06800.1 Zn(2)-C6 fungal-specific transcription factor [Mucor lusitanicus CBS 277.49]